LRLSDAQDFAELRLSQIEATNFPDPPSDGLQVKYEFNILLDCITFGSLLFSM
jgi:hypothetical protein